MEAAFLTASGLLLLGFVLRAKVKILQRYFIPASVAGGIVGLVAITALSPFRLSVGQQHESALNGQAIGAPLRQQFEAQGVRLSEGAACAVEAANAWRVTDGSRSYAVVKSKKRIEVYELRTGWNGQLIARQLRSWPGWLIAVVFAGLLLERSAKPFRQGLRLAARQGIVVWIIIVGEIAIGLLATWLVNPTDETGQPVPASFGQLIEVGFAGGHGTAAAMGNVYEESLGFDQGRDLGFLFATAGLVFGVISGIVYVNLAVRRRWTRDSDAKVQLLSGLEARRDPQPVAFGRVRPEVIDPLVFQSLIVAVAFMAGIGLQFAIMKTIPWLAMIGGANDQARDQIVKYAGNMPLFMFTLFGGLMVREAMHHLKIGDLMDPPSQHRITGAAMEFLIVAAISAMKIHVLVAFGAPVALLLVLGFAWTGFCLLFVARRLLPKAYWFELGILNYGMSTGTTAQGMMLLRIIDKDLESGAAEDYALAAPLSAPFIGGGVLTLVALPSLLEHVSAGWVGVALCVCVVVLFLAGVRLAGSEGDGRVSSVE